MSKRFFNLSKPYQESVYILNLLVFMLMLYKSCYVWNVYETCFFFNVIYWIFKSKIQNRCIVMNIYCLERCIPFSQGGALPRFVFHHKCNKYHTATQYHYPCSWCTSFVPDTLTTTSNFRIWRKYSQNNSLLMFKVTFYILEQIKFSLTLLKFCRILTVEYEVCFVNSDTKTVT